MCSDNVTEADCLAALGTWQGEGTTCADFQWVYVTTLTLADVSAQSDVVLAAQAAADYMVRYATGAYRYGAGAWSAHGVYLIYGGGNTNWIVQPPPGSSQSSAGVATTYYGTLPEIAKSHYFTHTGGDMTLRFGDSYYGDNLLGASPPQFEIWRKDTVDISCCDLAVTMGNTSLASTDGEAVAAQLSAAVITGGVELGRTITWEILRNGGVTEEIADPTASSRDWPVGITWLRLKVVDTNGCNKWVNFKVTVTAGAVLDCDVPSYELTLTEGVGDESVLLTAGTEVCTLTRNDSCVYFGQMFGANVNGLWWFDLTYDAGNNRWELLVYPSGNPSQSAFRRSGETAVGAFTYFSGSWAAASVISLA